ncbi:helix-turn-helix transcriptional regulator [Parasphingorhabdus sp. DH2-15]|uniref:helix-turn-helix transcriptional regulator n=1 Tax=Parasphingorhabdus sp. DH2-15 TaxID=3444112 RepID=UPI003F685C0D
MEDRYYTPKEAAEFLRVSVATLARWRTQISGPIYVKLGKRKNSPVRYRGSSLLLYTEVYGIPADQPQDAQ